MRTDLELESGVRCYSRTWPTVFVRAAGATLTDERGVDFLDLFAGAGVLSFGHNHPALVEAAIDHLGGGGLMHCLDTHTPERTAFLHAMRDRVLVPRDLDMVVQFVGPTGATAVEAALALARRVTGRRGVVAYAGGYHGMTERAAAVSASLDRPGSGRRFLPYVGDADPAAVELLDQALGTPLDGELPGALVIEPVQGEGGARPFDVGYLAAVRERCRARGVVLVADEVQAGVGRTGPFFSFEGSGLLPDVICLSKAISGLGVPLAVNLVSRRLDQWQPGEFTGTFRGNNLAFVTARAMLERWWSSPALVESTAALGTLVERGLRTVGERIADVVPTSISIHGRGLLWGIDTGSPELAASISRAAFENGVLVETCGKGGATVKVLPPLVITGDELASALDRLVDAAERAAAQPRVDLRPEVA